MGRTFLVDTGAQDALVPANRLREIGIEPFTERVYELADCTEKTVPVGGARLAFMGDQTTVDVIFGPDDTEPILGVIPLEAVGIETDPRTQRLHRRPAMRLKEATPSRKPSHARSESNQ